MEALIIYLTNKQAAEFEYDEKANIKLPAHVLEGITRGQEDMKAGRIITFEEFKKRHLSNN